LLLHPTVLGGQRGLHLPVAVLHHLTLYGPGLSAVAELAVSGPAAHCLLAPASSPASAAATGKRLLGGQTHYHRECQTDSHELLHRT
jgi:hypothetical protein